MTQPQDNQGPVWPSLNTPQQPVPPDLTARRDAQELAARRANDARLLAKYKGFKPLMIWYSVWAIIFFVGGISAFSSKSGGVGLGFFGLGLAAVSALYARYLYRGGLRRVWFFIF
jgi:hypothetical protein